MRIWAVVVSALLAGCGATLPADVLRTAPTAKDYPGADYVVLLDESEVTYELGAGTAPPQRVEIARYRIKVLKPTVLPPLAVGYSRTFTRVESIRAWTFDEKGEGRELDTSTKRSDRSATSDSVLFTDSRVVSVPVPPLAVGSIFESEIITRDLDTRPHLTAFMFGDTEPVKTSRLVVRLPASWELKWVVENGELEPAHTVSKDTQEYRFERTNLPGDNRRYLSRAPPPWLRRLKVNARLEKWTEGKDAKSAFATPAELSKWLATEYEARSVVTPEIQKQVDEVLAKVPDAEEDRARALYEFACKSVQYCAIEIGYGGWIPHGADAVQSARYGDCKDKANYLHTLLKAAGIKSAPTLIYAHDGWPKPFTLPSLGANFNHAILAVDLPHGRLVYADPTHRTVPWGQLPASDQGAPVLELRSKSVRINTTPTSTSGENTELQRLELDLDMAGNAAGKVALTATGAHAVSVKNQLVTHLGGLDDWLDKRLWVRAAHVTAAKANPGGDFDDSVELHGEVNVEHLVSRGSTGDALLRVGGLFDPWADFVDEERTEPIMWHVAETLSSTLAIKLPAGSTIGALPSALTYNYPFARYSLRWTREGDTVLVQRTFERLERVVEAKNFSLFNNFVRDVRKAEHRAAVIKLPLEANR